MSLKGRNWAFVMYPESMPDNWYELLQATGLPFAISPLHDKDVNPDGSVKKSHYHVMTYYENSTTAKQVQSQVTDLVNGTIPIKLESLHGMYRYHIHMDNPEKFQYDDRDRTFINGFDTSRVDSLTHFEITKCLIEIQDLIRKNHILEYSELMDILLDSDLHNLWEVAQSHTLFLNTYISSRRFKSKQEKIQDDVD